jgi:hypothetical protein
MAGITTDHVAMNASIGVGLEQPGHDRWSHVLCPITGHPCEGDLSWRCEDYGCARKAGLSPHSHENFLSCSDLVDAGSDLVRVCARVGFLRSSGRFRFCPSHVGHRLR